MGADDVEVANLLARAQVSVTPSVYRDAMGVTHRAPELLGLACIEAMSCATPVIVSDVGGLTEIVHHRVEGLVVPWGDVSALHAAITRMVANPAAARAMGERGLEAVRTKLNWHATADRCLQAYAGSAPH